MKLSRFKLLTLLFLATSLIVFPNRVFALDSMANTASYVLGQPNLEGCATGPNGQSYETGLYFPNFLSVFNGKLVVADYGDNRILIYNSLPTQNYATPDVVVGMSSACTRVNSGDELQRTVGPSATAYDGTNFLVLDFIGNRIGIYTHGIPTASGQRPDFVIGQTAYSNSYVTANQGSSVAANTLSSPYDMQIVNGKLIAVDRGNNRVLIYNSVPTSNNASADVVIGQPDMTHNTANNGGISAHSLSTPKGVFSDGTKLFISDYGNSRVLIFNSIPTSNNASADVVIGQPDMTHNTANNGGISASSLNLPYGVHVDGNGKLYVADGYNHRILIYNAVPTSNHVSADVVIGQADFTHGSANRGGAVAANDFNLPTGITTYEGKLIISDQANNRVLIFNSVPTSNNASADVVIGQPDMATSSTVISKTSGISASTLFMPMRIMYDGNKTFVNDRANYRILIYNGLPQNNGAAADVVVGQVDMNSNATAVAANRFLYPDGGAFSDGTKLFVADTGNKRVLIFNTIPTSNNASADVVIGQPNKTSKTVNNGGLSAKSLGSPGKLFSDGTKLFVADASNNRVLIFNTVPTSDFASADVVIGQPDMTSNAPNNGGISAHSLYSPQAVYVKNNKLYISDGLNNRVLIFNSIPTSNNASADVVIGQPDMTSNTLNNGGKGNKTLNYPYDVFVDDLDNLVISDEANSRVLIYNGIPTANFAEADAVIGQANFSSSVSNGYAYGVTNPFSAMIADNKLYVVDMWNDRVLIYPLGPNNTSFSTDTISGSTDVTLHLVADDAKEFMVSEDPSFTGASWHDFTSSYTFSLSPENGSKSIYLKFRDYALVSGDPLTPSDGAVTLDTVKPGKLKIGLSKTSVFEPGDKDITIGSKTLKLYFDTNDTTTTVTQITISQNKEFKGANWRPYDGDIKISFDHDGKKNIYIKFKDSAGNVSDTYKQIVKVNSIPPMLTLSSIGTITGNDLDLSKYKNYFYTDNKPVFKGASEEKAKVSLYVDNILVKEVDPVPQDGVWEISGYEFSQGKHDIKLTAKDTGGLSTDLSITLTIDPTYGQTQQVQGASDIKEPIIPVESPVQPIIPVTQIQETKPTFWQKLFGR